MKTLPMLLLLAFGMLAGRAAVTASSDSPPFVWVELDDPAAATIRSSGDELIKRIGTTLIYEVEHSLKADGLAKTLPVAHLHDFVPPNPPGPFRLAAIKRTSLQLRNPANAPDGPDRAVLAKIADALQEGDDVPPLLIQLVTPAGGPAEWRVSRPITTMPVCLQCHGKKESLAPEVRAWLDAHYPADAAADYSAYQWRGVIRVSFVEGPKAK
jgi:hypothetical protein